MKSQCFVLVLFITIQGALSQSFNWNSSSKLNSTGTRIIGGITIPITRAPYQVAVIARNPNNSTVMCGGSLISPSLVVTSTNCLYKRSGVAIPADNLTVYAGFDDWSDPNKISSEVLWIKVHKKFSVKNPKNDIALIKLKSNFTMSDKINVIRVSESKVSEGTNCTVSGWGSLSVFDEYSDKLMQAALPIYNKNKCANAYKEFDTKLPSNTLCAGFENERVGACNGDYGGPLVCNNVLTGISSFDLLCPRPKYPGVYTDISQYKGWIEKNNSNAVSSTFWLTIVVQIAAYYGLTK